ncbi:hypothetical protein [Acaryochloris sp. IP29b_bin.148]|uniref:hypothetical protein n=1 Tax=Acaryochloris sp. IP29b_bin.148 TaxID=2969218 RepID=UPI002634E302|nr:hypothetical protein [Acaryochloris sp. IP29b_bin.148]
MSQLFSDVSEQQQEKLSGGCMFCGSDGSQQDYGSQQNYGAPTMEMPAMSLPTGPGAAYPLPGSDPRHTGGGCPACGMG